MAAIISPGRYRIQLVAEPQPYIGQNSDNPFKEQIVTNGKYNLWAIQQGPNGSGYQLIVSKPAALFSKDDNGNVVGDVDPPATAWDLVKEEKGYTIQQPHTMMRVVWTVEKPSEPNCPVTFSVIRGLTQDNQLWNFFRVD